ncbi:hypothetical protein WN943_015099 [Citrus x changshan-huyou]
MIRLVLIAINSQDAQDRNTNSKHYGCMQFQYALAGSEDTTHDARIFVTTIHNSQMNFPQHPKGNIIQ